MIKKIASSTYWVSVKIIFTIILNLVVISILSRQLSPKEFGLVAIAGVLIEFLNILASQGIHEFIIYDQDNNKRNERINAAFWLDVSFGLFAFIFLIFLIPYFVDFFAYDDLGLIAFLMALRFPFDSVSRIPDALFKRELNFKLLELRDLSIQLLVGLISVYMAISGYGVWSLVVPTIFASPLRAIVVFNLTKWRPKLDLGLKYWKQIFDYSKNVIGSSFTTYIISQGDTLLIGKLLGPTLLGTYNISWRTSNLVSRTLIQIINKLALPVLAKSSNNLKSLRLSFEKILVLVAVSSFVPLIGLFVLADLFILVVNGDQWLDAILPLRILIIYAMRHTVSTPIGAVFKALGKPQINFKIGLFIVPFYLVGILIGSEYGIVGVAVAVTIVRTFSGILSFYLVSRELNTSFLDLSMKLLDPFLLAFMMGVLLILLRLLFHTINFSNPILILLISSLSGIFIILLLLRFIFKKLSGQITIYMSNILPKKLFNLFSIILNEKNRI